MVVVFAVLLALAANAGLFGIALGVIVTSWLFKYAYVLFDHVVRGVDEPPVLDLNMVNPFNEQRPLAQLIILGIVGGSVALAAYRLPVAVAVVLGVVATLLIPASVAILGLEGNPLKAVYPVALVRMVAGLGVLYIQILGVIAGYAIALGLLGKLHLWLPLELALSLFAVLSIFSGLGGALYERRHELGLETWHSPERTAEKERTVTLRQSQDTVTEAYGLLRVGAHGKAWALLENWLTSRGNTLEDYRWLCESVASWPDARYANRLTDEFVDRLLVHKRTGEALDVVTKRLRVDASYRPKSAATALQIARLAAHGGGAPGVARTLLRDFATAYAGSPLVETATALAQRPGDSGPTSATGARE